MREQLAALGGEEDCWAETVDLTDSVYRDVQKHEGVLDFVRSALEEGDLLDRLLAAEIVLGLEAEDGVVGRVEEDQATLEGLLTALEELPYSFPRDHLSVTELSVMRTARALWGTAIRTPNLFVEALATRSPQMQRRALSSCCELRDMSLFAIRIISLEALRLGLHLWDEKTAHAVVWSCYHYLGVRFSVDFARLATANLGQLSAAAATLISEIDNEGVDLHGGHLDDPGSWWMHGE